MTAYERCSRRQIAIGLLLAPLTPSALSQQVPVPSAASQPAQAELSTDLVKTGLYLISGGGCNSLLRLSPAGTVLVGGKSPGTYRALMSQVRRINKISDLPLRVVIFPNHHDIHAGNYAQFVDAGIAVFTQTRALHHLPQALTRSIGASAAVAQKTPGPTYDIERSHDLRMGGVEVRLHHFGRASTGDDVVVLFPALGVLAVGELYCAGAPVPDFAGGGSLASWGPVLQEMLKLDFDVAVPSVGPPVSRAEVVAFKARVDTLTSRAIALVKAGVDKSRFLSQLTIDDLGWTLRLERDEVVQLYVDLSQTF
jgi:glyoxylase-like metal-dependent hydrolase (beta-lactamase superfamily II)